MGERREAEPVREFRFEGVGLVVVMAGVLLALAGAFWTGRWYERRQAPPSPAGGPLESGPLTHVVDPQDPLDTDVSADYFDAADGGERELESDRQVRTPAPPPEEPPLARAGGATEETAAARIGGSFYVQVFAGRDRSSAERLVGQLESDGFSVRLFTENPGADPLFKVRVGGYGTKDEAREAATTLQKKGHAGAFVTELGG